MLFGKQKSPECPSCRKELVRGAPINQVGNGSPALTVTGVPALVCPGCGHTQATPAADAFIKELSIDTRLNRRGASEPVEPLVISLSPTSAPAADADIPLYDRLALADNPDSLDDLQLTVELRERLLDFVHGVVSQARIQTALGPRLGRDATRSILNLWGPPGTGKTTIAKALAHALGRDLFTLNAAGLESSKVGETEKNIVNLFRSVRESGAVLLIDEADSLVDARTRAQNGHEKSINQARNVLINQLNAFAGVAIFASNLRENYDPALARRMEELHVPPPSERQLRWLLTAALRQMSLDSRVTENWVGELGRRIVAHERSHGDPARPFTAADVNAVLRGAVRTASRRRPDDGRPLMVQRTEIEAALQQHCKQLAAAHKPDPETLRRKMLSEASGILPELLAGHVRRHAQASSGRPPLAASDRAYRPAAETTMTDALAHTQLLIADLGRVANMLTTADVDELPQLLQSFVAPATQYTGTTNRA